MTGILHELYETERSIQVSGDSIQKLKRDATTKVMHNESVLLLRVGRDFYLKPNKFADWRQITLTKALEITNLWKLQKQ